MKKQNKLSPELKAFQTNLLSALQEDIISTMSIFTEIEDIFEPSLDTTVVTIQELFKSDQSLLSIVEESKKPASHTSLIFWLITLYLEERRPDILSVSPVDLAEGKAILYIIDLVDELARQAGSVTSEMVAEYYEKK